MRCYIESFEIRPILCITRYIRFCIVEVKEICVGECVEVRFTLENKGKYPAAEVVQCYIRDEFASVTRPVRELADYKKLYLEPGAKCEVTLHIDPSSLAFYGQDMKLTTEPGRFMVYVGGDSNAPLCGEFHIVQ